LKPNLSSFQHDKKHLVDQGGDAGTSTSAAAILGSLDAPGTASIASASSASGDALQFAVNGTADHVVNATEATDVAYTVSGLATGEIGTVTFTDADHHQVSANVTGNGIYNADLSSLTDGTITSSLSAANPAGNGHTASGNSVLLDTDKDVQPVVSVDAANPAHVIFNISGLEGDEHGTMTFADTAGQQAVVNVGSNGSYAADLSSLKQGTITYLLTETDPAGNTVSVDPPISLGDGSANAPSGTPQLSNILSGYAVRPTWNVAGVDYHVGTPSGAVLKDPSSISMAGVSVDKSAHIVTVSNSNVTLDGYDFGLSGGWQVDVVNNANNITIQNSHFQVGANDLMPIQAYYGGTINVLNNTFDGGASGGSSANAMVFTGTGGATIEYNRFTNFPNDGIDITHDGNYVVQYNVFDTAGAGAFHTDAIQTYFSAISSLSIQYNTMYEPPGFSNSGINSFVRIGDQQGNVVHNPVAAYNTIIMASTNAEAANVFQWGAGGTATLVNPQIHDNFINPQGVMYGVVSPYMQDPSGVVNPVTYNNVNLTTGKALLTGLYNSYSAGVPSAPPAAPVITGESAVSATQVKLAGTAGASTTVDIYDQGALLGTVKASGGAWSFTTPQLANGDHSFTARATDSLTNSSAPSAALAITVTSSGTSVPPSAPPPTAPPPSAPTIASFSTDSGVVGDHITNDNTLTLTGAAAANSTVKVFDGTTQIGTATANGSGAWSYTTAALADGSHNFTSTATSSGVTGPASTALAVTVDTVAPSAPVIASSAPGSNNAFLLRGTAEANSSVEVFDGTTQVGTVTANSSGAWSFTTAALTNGSHSFTAKAMDAAGNIGVASAALPLAVATPSAPGAPTIASFSPDSGVVGDGITNHNTLTLTGTASANSTVKIFDGSAQIGTTTANSSGSWDYITSVLSDAKHILTAKATDSSGQTGAASSALSVTVDTHVPAAPVLVSDPVVNTNHVLLSGTAEANSTITVYDGTTAVGTTTAGTNGAWSVTTGALATGSQVLTATATDVAGTTSAHSQALDSVIGSSAPGGSAPSAPTIVSYSQDSGIVGDHITSDNTLTLTGTAVANSTVTVFDGTTKIGTATANSSGAWNYTTAALSDGSHSLTATDTDSSAHTSSASSALSVTIDTHAPAAPTMAVYSQGGAAVGGTTTVDDLLLKGTAEANSTVHVFDGGKQIGTATTNGSGLWSFDTGHVADGSHSFTSTAIDAAGNASAASAVKGVTVDVDAPASAVGITNMYENSSDIVTIKGTADAYSQIKVYDGTKSVGMVKTGADGTWSFTSSSAVSNKVHTFTAQELDSTGHVVASSGSAILGSTGRDTLTSTAGNDLFVGNGHHDTFVFASNFGNDVINDFRANGRGHDVVQFSKSVFDSFADILAHATQSGNNVVIADGTGDSLTLKNVKLAALDKHDFHFA
jgi:hypothetical protein